MSAQDGATPAQSGAALTRGYTASKDQLQTRLRRIEGQVRGVQGMVDEDLRRSTEPRADLGLADVLGGALGAVAVHHPNELPLVKRTVSDLGHRQRVRPLLLARAGSGRRFPPDWRDAPCGYGFPAGAR